MFNNLKALIRLTYPHRIWMLLGVLATISAAFFAWSNPKIIANLIDHGINPQSRSIAVKYVLLLAACELMRLLSVAAMLSLFARIAYLVIKYPFNISIKPLLVAS
jgi:ABC-type multidrug transport system fused ATPase/permease subunit